MEMSDMAGDQMMEYRKKIWFLDYEHFT